MQKKLDRLRLRVDSLNRRCCNNQPCDSHRNSCNRIYFACTIRLSVFTSRCMIIGVAMIHPSQSFRANREKEQKKGFQLTHSPRLLIMSGWISGWFKGSAGGEAPAPAAAADAGQSSEPAEGTLAQQHAEEEPQPLHPERALTTDMADATRSTRVAGSSGTGSAETAEQIREKRLRKLQATSAAAAANASATAAADDKTAASSNAAAAAPATSPAAAAAVAKAPAATNATPPVAGAAASTPTKSFSAPAPAAASAPRRVTPPASPLSPARKVPHASSPSAAAAAPTPSVSLPSSPSKAALPSIHAVPASAYAALRSALPLGLLVGYTPGPGVTPGALTRAWENAALGDMFHVTVIDPAGNGNSSSSRQAGRVYLPGLSAELAVASPQPPEPQVAPAAAASASFVSSDAAPYREPLHLMHRTYLDSILTERLVQQNEQSPGSSAFSWLISAYRRGQEIESKLQQGLASATAAGSHSNSVYPSAPAEWAACSECVRLAATCLVRYIGLILSDEDMFQNGAARVAGRSEFMRLLCSDSHVARTLPHGLLDALVATYTVEDEAFLQIWKPVTDELALPVKFLPTTSRLGETQPSLEDASRQLQGLVQLFRFPAVAKLVVQHPSFLPKVPFGRLLMSVSTLGALMSIGASSADPAFQHVLNQRPHHEVESEVTRMRNSFASYQQLCAQLFKNGVRDAFIRESLLQWLASFVHSNRSRCRMQFHPFEVSSDALCWNVIHVALQLSQPIIRKNTRADLEKVNLAYLLQGANQRIDFDVITRVTATLAEVKAMRAALPSPLVFTPHTPPFSPFNFVSECFFLTHSILSLGLGSIMRQYTELMQEVGRKSRLLQTIPPDSLMYEQLQAELDHLFAINLATRVHLQDPALLTDVIAFFEWSAQWILFHQSEDEANKERARRPSVEAANAMALASISDAAVPAVAAAAAAAASLAAAPAAAAASASSSSVAARPLSLGSLIPEPIVELITEYGLYLGRFQSAQLLQLPQSSYRCILDLVLALAAGPSALKNPHLRSSLAEFLLSLLPPSHDATTEHVFNTHPAMRAKLVPTLLELYVSVEDGRGMYYQKFSTRNQISMLLEFVWQLPEHKAKLLAVAADTRSSSLFGRFTNVLANDLIYLLDEGLKQLTEIRSIQLEMEDEQRWASQTQAVLQDRQRAYTQSEQGATSCLTLANATVHLLYYLSAEFIAPFVTPEFVQRMAHMLDYCQSPTVTVSLGSLACGHRGPARVAPIRRFVLISRVFSCVLCACCVCV